MGVLLYVFFAASFANIVNFGQHAVCPEDKYLNKSGNQEPRERKVHLGAWRESAFAGSGDLAMSLGARSPSSFSHGVA